LHVECRIGTAVRFTRRRHKEARLRKLKQFGDIFTDAVALLAARKQRDWSVSAVASSLHDGAELRAQAGRSGRDEGEPASIRLST
jgi:hypothetical protein